MNNFFRQVGTHRTYLILNLILVGAMSRLIPHPPNFTAIAATGLFGGFYLRSVKSSAIAVLVSMLLSDMVIGFHSLVPVVYGALLFSVAIGWFSKNSNKRTLLFAGAVLSSFTFFIITNFAVWWQGFLYPKTLTGLYTCYIAAIPFLGNQLAGDLFFGAVLFGSLHLAQTLSPMFRFESTAVA